ncbi:4705_t:CDS:2 [Ambispora leptoticha]|uniref:Biogenesis of lysosome-related organelles complex 1 subunit 1 n=1 Tax=Ambispora leptoticha TaxID=144679 RepID=A0A9N9GE80_9GLOM|nr:4705_t:CDS:2 [Ambispora leptoticha]
MLTRLVRDHNQKQQNIRRNNEQLRKEVIQSVSEVSDALSESLNERVASVFKTQREIESEIRKLSVQTSKHTKQAKQWITLMDGLSAALKEIGDVQNWAEVIEQDMRDIAMTLEYVHRGTMDGESVDVTDTNTHTLTSASTSIPLPPSSHTTSPGSLNETSSTATSTVDQNIIEKKSL